MRRRKTSNEHIASWRGNSTPTKIQGMRRGLGCALNSCHLHVTLDFAVRYTKVSICARKHQFTRDVAVKLFTVHNSPGREPRTSLWWSGCVDPAHSLLCRTVHTKSPYIIQYFVCKVSFLWSAIFVCVAKCPWVRAWHRHHPASGVTVPRLLLCHPSPSSPLPPETRCVV